MTIFLNPTVEKLALALHSKNQSVAARRVAELQPLGNRPPFFFIQAEPRFLELQRNFAPYFAPDQPILCPIADEHLASALPYDLRKNAEYHVDTILTVQPNGPYFVGGYSAGGVMAFEICQQLWSRGRHVELLVLFDTPNPYFMCEYSLVERFKARQQARWAVVRKLRGEELLEFIFEKLKTIRARAATRFRRTLFKLNLIAGMNPDDPPEDLFWARRASAMYYKPETYPGSCASIQANRVSKWSLPGSRVWLG